MQARFDDLCLEEHDAADQAFREDMSSSSENSGSCTDGLHATEVAPQVDAVRRRKMGRPRVDGEIDQAEHLTRHPLSELTGDADHIRRNSILAQLRDMDSPITVFLVDEQVLHPWSHYVVARELGVEIEYVRVAPADQVALLMQLVRGEAKLGPGNRAMTAVVVTEGRWSGPGRPKNSATVAEFSASRERQAALAECSVRTVDEARRVYSYIRPALRDDAHREILRDVMQGRKSLQEAFRSLNYGRPDPSRRQYYSLTPTERLANVERELREVRAKWEADIKKIHKLERERDELKTTVALRDKEIAGLRAQLEGSWDQSVLSQEPGPETVVQATA